MCDKLLLTSHTDKTIDVGEIQGNIFSCICKGVGTSAQSLQATEKITHFTTTNQRCANIATVSKKTQPTHTHKTKDLSELALKIKQVG